MHQEALFGGCCIAVRPIFVQPYAIMTWTISGEAGIRTSPKFFYEFGILEQGSAKSGALRVLDPRLGSLIEAWPTLPEPIRAGILAMIRAARG